MSLRITINDRPMEVEAGLTILDAARLNGIEIPTLCHYPGLPSHGSCRLCIVEIQGRANTPTACTTPVEEGMVVQTHTPKVQELRCELLQMLLAEHPSACLQCPENSNCEECMLTLRKAEMTVGCRSCPEDGQCEFQALVRQVGVTQADYPMRYRMLPVEKNDPFFDRDYNLCVLCGRCVRMCEELHFTPTLTFTQRGAEAVVGTAFGRSHLQSNCSFCGACLEVCPTGTLSEKTRKWEGRADAQTTSTCPLCGLGCSLTVESRNGRVLGCRPDADAGSDTLCVMGRFGVPELVNRPERLKQPLRYSSGIQIKLGWEDAVQEAAAKLAACPPDKFQLLISADTSSEDLFIAQKFTRQVMGSGNIRVPELEISASAARLISVSAPLAALQDAQAVLCLGLNDPYAYSVVETAVKRAARDGARIIAMDSRPEGVNRGAEICLTAGPGEEQVELETLLAALERPGKGDPADEISQAAGLLMAAPQAVILVGAEWLIHPGTPGLLEVVVRLAERLEAQVVCLTAHANLPGALWLGLSGQPERAAALAEADPQVMYLIGASLPEGIDRPDYVIYQNSYPAQPGEVADLVLPAAAFTETDGTTIDQGGIVRAMNRAVMPRGEALPSWQILCRIAQEMGFEGFDYPGVAEIQAEIERLLPGFAIGRPIDRSHGLPGAGFGDAGSTAANVHEYNGFPLAAWVEGLRWLYPDWQD